MGRQTGRRRGWRLQALLGAIMTLAGISLLVTAEQPAASPAAAETVALAIGDDWFCDASNEGGVCETTITAGDSVEWQWTGSAPHTTTECGGDLDNCPA